MTAHDSHRAALVSRSGSIQSFFSLKLIPNTHIIRPRLENYLGLAARLRWSGSARN